MVDIPFDTNSLGESFADVPRGMTELVYSFSEPLIDEPVREVSSEELASFSKRLKREGGGGFLEEIPGLDEEIEVFVDSIQDKSPKEKIYAVEKYVREIGYYDFDNGDVSPMKRGGYTDEMFLCDEKQTRCPQRRKANHR